jgi:hypothetical protein
VGISPSLTPTGGVVHCVVVATPSVQPQANSSSTLGLASVTVATGPPAFANAIQVQTRDATGALNDSDYFIQVSCPAG